ncbi:MAG: acyl-coenzyme A thioesterase PaaI-like protein [Cognaticolwellia sp.]|jgi:acyl-coenzyme A thioesterase PaaI-like protein
MNPNDLRPMLTSMVPFISTVGIVLDEIGIGSAVATLPARKEVQNHMGTAHAGAVYSLGESASGGVVLSLFADQLPKVFIALKSSTVAHKKAAAGDVVATASLNLDPKVIRARYDETGKSDFEVAVALHCGDVLTAEITFTWAVRAPRG